MAYYAPPQRPDELYHYGRLGMKWYKHIFGPVQSIAKYASKGHPSAKPMTKEERDEFKKNKKLAKEEAKQERKEVHDAKKAEKEAEKKEKMIRDANPDTIYKNRQKFTDEELRRVYDRINNDSKLKNMTTSELRKQQEAEEQAANRQTLNEFLKTVDSTVRTVSNVANTVDNAMNTIDKFKKYTPAAQAREKKKKDIMTNMNAKEFLDNYSMFNDKETKEFLNRQKNLNNIYDNYTSGRHDENTHGKHNSKESNNTSNSKKVNLSNKQMQDIVDMVKEDLKKEDD